MENDKLEINVALQISKPIEVVFEAIVNPDHMSNYFISKSSGRMVTGSNLIWKFPEFDMEFPITVESVEKNGRIAYRWGEPHEETLVELTLEAIEKDKTLVRVIEKSKENNKEGIAWLMGNSFGWSNFLACLKAYLEYNINLRQGSFDFMRK